MFTATRLRRMSHTSQLSSGGFNLDYSWWYFNTDEGARESRGHCWVSRLRRSSVAFHSHAMICFWFTFSSHSLHFRSISQLVMRLRGALWLFVNECVSSRSYLFVLVNHKPASSRGTVILHKQSQNTREGNKQAREGGRRGGNEKKLEEQKKDRGVACFGKTATLLQGPGAQRRHTWPIPHLELVDRNLMPTLTSEPHSRKRRRELWDRKYSPHLLHVKHKSVCDCAVAATWGTP